MYPYPRSRSLMVEHMAPSITYNHDNNPYRGHGQRSSSDNCFPSLNSTQLAHGSARSIGLGSIPSENYLTAVVMVLYMNHTHSIYAGQAYIAVANRLYSVFTAVIHILIFDGSCYRLGTWFIKVTKVHVKSFLYVH